MLVLDSTHGSPMFDTKPDARRLEEDLVRYGCMEMANSKNVLVRAHRGRLQYTMHLLHRALPPDVRFLAHWKDIRLAAVYARHGMGIRKCADYGAPEGGEVYSGGAPYVEFRAHGTGSHVLEDTDQMVTFNLGGRFLGGGTALRKNGGYHIEFMDHADYGSILEYVRKADPEWVVTDYARGRQGARLAEAIRNMGISAVARPMG